MDLTLTLLSVTVFSAARLMLICFWWCVLLSHGNNCPVLSGRESETD
ncbi:hypothetical protein GYH30_041953 [Glycine max]|uniref:Uncharacterized protein n=1 Tax=Glycine max TaxID=3847 RepID=A0A0R0FYX7_SOYBN|nr:hypothetical protein GYH30_041953 [Glycine max]